MRLGRTSSRTGPSWAALAAALCAAAVAVTALGVADAAPLDVHAPDVLATPGPLYSSNASTGAPCNSTPVPGLTIAVSARSPATPAPLPLAPPVTPRHPATDAIFYFEETGLGYGTSWGVLLISNASGLPVGYNNSTSNTINYTVASGTYVYYVPPVSGYLQAFCGIVTVNGTADQIPVPFTPFPQWAPPAFLAGIALWSLFAAAVSVSLVRRP